MKCKTRKDFLYSENALIFNKKELWSTIFLTLNVPYIMSNSWFKKIGHSKWKYKAGMKIRHFFHGSGSGSGAGKKFRIRIRP